MVLLGTIVNGLAIIIGACLGAIIKNIPEGVKSTVMQAIALAVIILGISMGLQTEQFLIVIGSLVIGSILGERWALEDRLNQLGKWLEKKSGSKEEGSVAKAFVTTTLIYVVGAMAVVGALDSGLRSDHSVLYTKAMLDGFSAIIFTSTLGFGVIFSAIPVIIYQGTIALFATQIDKFIPSELMDAFIVEMTAVGGIMILGIGLNIIGLLKVRVANLLPAILVTAVLVPIVYYWTTIVSFTQMYVPFIG
ncbi:DUF554 domain-containing protein [Desertibacillus haloalkaliphilus]|uniref:DUF554 domain-containing protein n=1 Tax=Desertibacillus haloalkaliphilus TaxID=1328930 RepID=UPI001C27872D|nr:DUF554 domain-containing protein [Desertibacillus haloalkaliphilus]MBU8905769.1 DUF554 domain-containing protein [Desertibacillus haloalkaliphilus]